jgi:DNA adenine methylase
MSQNVELKITQAESARPFIKWAGGKGQLLNEILAVLPEDVERYHEPFLGGAAVFFALPQRPKQSFLSDVSSELINCYTVVRDKQEELLRAVEKHPYSEEHFYQLREADRKDDYKSWSDVDKAARFIYLNKTCFNGLYRVNSKGQFNVPFGKYKNPKILAPANLERCAQALKKAQCRVGSFETILAEVQAGDFLYLDPPYHPRSTTSSFTSYSKEGFSQETQIRLKEFCDAVDKKGAKFLLSNSFTTLILHLYKDYQVDTVDASRAINSVASKRGKLKEVLVRNY